MAFVCNVCGWEGKDEERVRASRAWIKANDVDRDWFLSHQLNCPECGDASWRLTGEDAAENDPDFVAAQSAHEELRAETAQLEDQLAPEGNVSPLRFGHEMPALPAAKHGHGLGSIARRDQCKCGRNRDRG